MDETTLQYRTHNGGVQEEVFPIETNASGGDFAHGDPISSLVSARSALGMTEGQLEIGDAKRRIVCQIDPCEAALVAMVGYRRIRDRYLCRVGFSAREVDESSREGDAVLPLTGRPIRLHLSARGV